MLVYADISENQANRFPNIVNEFRDPVIMHKTGYLSLSIFAY